MRRPHQPEEARGSNWLQRINPFLLLLSLRNKKWGNDKNCPLLQPSCSWSHPLENKAHCPLSPATSLCPPLALASAAGLIPCRTKPHCPLSPATSLCLSLALAFSQMLLKARPTERSCCTIFSQPSSLLIKLLDMRYLL
jgi:hypothetical protein